MSDPIIVIARAHVRPESRAKFVAAALECVTATRREHGCLAYDLHESVTEPGHFVFVESWEQREHVDLHMRQPHLRAFLIAAGACVENAPVIEVIAPRSIDRL